MVKFAIIIFIFWTLIKGQPLEWIEKIKSFEYLYSDKPQSPRYSPALGNGHLSTVLYSDSVFMSGLYSGNLTNKNSIHRARIPSLINIVLCSIDNKFINKTHCALDLQNSIYYQINNNAVKQTTYFHRKYKFLLVHEIHSYDNFPHEICLFSNPGPLSSDINFTLIRKIDNYQIYNGWTQNTEILNKNQTRIILIIPTIAENIKNLQTGKIPSWNLCTKIDKNIPFKYYSAIFKDNSDIENYLSKFIFITNINNLKELHIKEWEKLRKNGGSVSADGFPLLSKAINSSLYELLISTDPEEMYSISPGGLSTNNYNGHVFWDFEIWMFPVLAVLYPPTAKNGILYRYNSINGAKEKAKQNNYDGAMWPWESAGSGEEVTPYTAITGLLEHHISGDIVFAARQYYLLHRNETFLKNEICKIATETAKFWASRVQKDAKDLYHILNVIPPDEFAVNVSDSAYTNMIAKISLIFASRKCTQNDTWEEIAENLCVPQGFSENIILEHIGYKFGTLVKQADIILLSFPLEFINDLEIARQNFEYYKKVISPWGPAMTWPMFFIQSLDFSNTTSDVTESIRSFFYKSFMSNTKGPYMVWWEFSDIGATHFATGAGGFLQAIIYGFIGLRVYYNKTEPNILAKLKPFNCILPVEQIEVKGIQLLEGAIRLDIRLANKLVYIKSNTNEIYLQRFNTKENFTLQNDSWVALESDISLQNHDFYFIIKNLTNNLIS